VKIADETLLFIGLAALRQGLSEILCMSHNSVGRRWLWLERNDRPALRLVVA
jgi:hypothetical protein